MVSKLLVFVKSQIAWIVGTTTGWVITWNMIAHSVITIITACVITIATFFINRYLNKRFPKNKTE